MWVQWVCSRVENSAINYKIDHQHSLSFLVSYWWESHLDLYTFTSLWNILLCLDSLSSFQRWWAGEVVKHCYESGTAVEVVEDKSSHPTLYILELRVCSQSSWQACSTGSDAKMGFECHLLQVGCPNPQVSQKATNVSVFCCCFCLFL